MLIEVSTVNPSAAHPAPRHRPVLLSEALSLLAVRAGSLAVDCTVGMGGHTRALLEAVGPSGRVIGVDRDAESLAVARENLKDFGDRFVPFQADYRDLAAVLSEKQIGPVAALLADFGFSSYQMDTPERGFSFAHEGPLDMRLDRTRGTTAAQLVETLDEKEIARVLREFGEERAARRIAAAIVRARGKEPLRSTRQLARVVEAAVPAARRYAIHPATRTFQALRIAVNRELEGLESFVTDACHLLEPGGRAAFIAFHSLEDRAVKQAIATLVPHCVCPPSLPQCVCGSPGVVERLTRKAVRPAEAEVLGNPRSRSARLRAVRRLEAAP